uniref:Uncharacterized protein n=1 Tax=Pseudomonas aeruginosa TaxID=287 RepID=A0A6C0L3G2_PSEAI|nr:hypothetical protein [Pseudomonas aeruginosa]
MVSHTIDYRLRLLDGAYGKPIDYKFRLTPIDYRSMHRRSTRTVGLL